MATIILLVTLRPIDVQKAGYWESYGLCLYLWAAGRVNRNCVRSADYYHPSGLINDSDLPVYAIYEKRWTFSSKRR